MFDIDDREVQMMASSHTTYMRGVDYYKKNQITLLTFDKTNLLFKFVAYGTNLYRFSKKDYGGLKWKR